MSRGYVYILTNESMPGLVKIGKTTREVQARADEISGATGVPTAFKILHLVLSPDCHALEKMVHERFPDVRVSLNREFFRIDEETAIGVLEDAHREIVEEWLEWFLPDHQIVHSDEFIDIGALKESTIEVFKTEGVLPPDVPLVLYEIEGGEIKNAVIRRQEKVARRAEEMRQKVAMRVVGDE